MVTPVWWELNRLVGRTTDTSQLLWDVTQTENNRPAAEEQHMQAALLGA